MSETRAPIYLLGRSTREHDALIELLDLPIITDQERLLLSTNKPLTPAQMDRQIKRCFNIMLSELNHTRRELLHTTAKSTQNKAKDDQRIADILKYGNENVIRPVVVLSERRHKVFEQRLRLVDTMFKEILLLWESQFKLPWKEEPSK